MSGAPAALYLWPAVRSRRCAQPCACVDGGKRHRYIDGKERTHWPAFYYGVKRFDSVAPLVRKSDDAGARVANVGGAVATTPKQSGQASEGLRDHVLEHYERRVREEYGLGARLHPFSIRPKIPQTDRSRPFMIEALEHEIRNILEQRTSQRDTAMQDARARRARLTERLAKGTQ